MGFNSIILDLRASLISEFFLKDKILTEEINGPIEVNNEKHQINRLFIIYQTEKK